MTSLPRLTQIRIPALPVLYLVSANACAMENSRRFYQELGHLFYAIAAADKKIARAEVEQLDQEVQYAWKHFEGSRDRFGTDRAYLIEFQFETLDDQGFDAEAAFSSFEAYFREFGDRIDHHTRNHIFQSARHIAERIRKINQEELRYLVRLKALMGV